MTSTPRNIELFNRLVALTLLRLYEQFPEPHDLDPRMIGREATEAFTSEEEEEAFGVVMTTAGETIEFLAEEGFLRYRSEYRTVGERTFPQARLTLRGLTILGLVPESVTQAGERKTLAAQLKSGVEKGAQDALAGTVSSVFASLIKLGTDAVVGTF